MFKCLIEIDRLMNKKRWHVYVDYEARKEIYEIYSYYRSNHPDWKVKLPYIMNKFIKKKFLERVHDEIEEDHKELQQAIDEAFEKKQAWRRKDRNTDKHNLI